MYAVQWTMALKGLTMSYCVILIFKSSKSRHRTSRGLEHLRESNDSSTWTSRGPKHLDYSNDSSTWTSRGPKHLDYSNDSSTWTYRGPKHLDYSNDSSTWTSQKPKHLDYSNISRTWTSRRLENLDRLVEYYIGPVKVRVIKESHHEFFATKNVVRSLTHSIPWNIVCLLYYIFFKHGSRLGTESILVIVIIMFKNTLIILNNIE